MVSTVSTSKYSNGLPGSRLLVGFVSRLSAFCCTIPNHLSQPEFIYNDQNSEQSPYDNLPAATAVREVGGMGSYWTCSTPEQHPEIERSDIFSNEEWNDLYDEARALFHTTNTAFDHSIRQEIVKDTLRKASKGREFVSMPLACQRSTHNSDYVEWTATATILGDLADPKYTGGNFELRAQHCCTRLQIDAASRHVVGAELKSLLTNEVLLVKAKKNVICAGAILTAGILFNSQIRPDTGYPAFVRPH
jgi:pyranose oxidase